MTRYKRKWDCAVCGKPVIYDPKENTVSCDCGTVKIVPLSLNDIVLNWERIQQ